MITNPPIVIATPTVKPQATIAVYTSIPKTPAPGQSGSSTAKPTTTGSLKRGSQGDEVREVQRLLRTLGYLSGSADGDFGEATEKAVIAFQRANKLEVDGKVGSATLAKLKSKDAVTAKQASATGAPVSETLKNGSQGTEVRVLQRRLRELGYYSGSVDGDFGSSTEAAVRAFQKANGLKVDGKAGAETMAVMNSASAINAVQANATKAPQGTITVDEALKNGSSGDRVREVQRRLKTLGYYSGSVDGAFGDTTEMAVRAFQQANGLKVDGKVGTNTLARLNSADAIKAVAVVTLKPTAKPTAAPKPTATPRTDVYLELDSKNANVTKLQNRLIELGYLSGKADGYYGGATEAAVYAFQARTSGLYEDGKAGPLTLEKLYASDARRARSVTSSVGEVLELGSQGEDVKALQTRLRKLGYLSASADGSYGANTVAAVTAFQQVNGLKADGKAGTKTLNLIYLSTTSAVDATPVPQATIKPGADGEDITTTGYTTLRLKDEGEAVRKLQQALKDIGLYSGRVDGVYGSGTVTAVTSFQTVMNLKVDGVAGPATQRALYNTGGGSIEYATLRPGDSSSAVKNMQYTLYELGYYDDTISGYYGSTTKDAVQAFQSRNKVSPVDGIAGSKTLKALYSANAISASKPATDFTSVKLGDYGETVLAVKDSLIRLGYPTTSDTNVFDEQTRQAVMLFQKYNGLKVDGVAGQDTQAKLYSDSAVRNPE